MQPCSHRRLQSRWHRIWATWLTAATTSLVALEAVAYVRGGNAAMLTAYLRHASAVDPYCTRHGRLGRAVILALLSWCAAHLAFGVPGLLPHRRSKC